MSAELAPLEPITLSNFNDHPRFPPECRMAIYQHLLSRTILKDHPPILFALHGTPMYEMLQDEYRKRNFYLTERTLSAYARLGSHDKSLDRIHYLHIQGNRAFRFYPDVDVYIWFFRQHASLGANRFREINIEVRLLEGTSYVDILQTSHQMAMASTAARTTVRFRFVRSDAQAVRDYCWHMNYVAGMARGGKRWKMGRRELRGVDGVLYGKGEVIWVWVAFRNPREVQLEVEGWRGWGAFVTRALDVLWWVWVCFVGK